MQCNPDCDLSGDSVCAVSINRTQSKTDCFFPASLQYIPHKFTLCYKQFYDVEYLHRNGKITSQNMLETERIMI